MTNPDDFIEWLNYQNFPTFKAMYTYMKHNGGLTEDNKFPSQIIKDAANQWFLDNRGEIERTEKITRKDVTGLYEVVRDKLGRFINWWKAED